MKIFEGKSPTERNKIIAAIVLGALAVLAIGYNIIGFFPSRKTTVNVTVTPTPSPSISSGGGDTVVTALPKIDEMERVYLSVPVSMPYTPGAPDAGRNIFAFKEPPSPTPYSPTPTPEIKTPPPIPQPTPNVMVSYLSRQSVYAGEKGFRLEIGGDKFTPETYIYFNGSQLPTNFVSPQMLTADIPENFIAGGGEQKQVEQKIIEVRSSDGKLFSNRVIFNVNPQPLPQFQYIGVVSRKAGNNDTAYFQMPGKNVPIEGCCRLGDLVGPNGGKGDFRLISISRDRVVVEDKNLKFRHTVELIKPGQNPNSTRNNSGFTDNNPQNNPNRQCVPGIPCNIPQFQQPTPQQPKKDDDDDDGDN